MNPDGEYSIIDIDCRSCESFHVCKLWPAVTLCDDYDDAVAQANFRRSRLICFVFMAGVCFALLAVAIMAGVFR